MEKVETQRKEDDVEQLATPTIIVIERSTGKKYYASYAPNRLGRYWVDGKFYTDANFDRKYQILMHAYDTPLSVQNNEKK